MYIRKACTVNNIGRIDLVKQKLISDIEQSV